MSDNKVDALYKAVSLHETIGLGGGLWCLIEPLMAGGVASVDRTLMYVKLSSFC